MSDQEILEKAIRKAIDSGWLKIKNKARFSRVEDATDYGEGLFVHLKGRTYPTSFPSVEALIFSHDFAKALWGSKFHLESPAIFVPNWKHHLQQMVVAEDPIKYLGENL